MGPLNLFSYYWWDYSQSKVVWWSTTNLLCGFLPQEQNNVSVCYIRFTLNHVTSSFCPCHYPCGHQGVLQMKTCLCFLFFLFFFCLHVWRDWIGRCTVSIFRSEQLRRDSLLPAVVTQVHDAASRVRINDCTQQGTLISHTLHFFNNCTFDFFV